MRALVLVCLTLTLLAPAARAELIIADSLEWIAQDSDLILRGKLVSVTRLPKKVNGYTWSKVTMSVAETLRGAHRRTRVFSVCDGHSPARWDKQRGEVLAFLVKPGRVQSGRGSEQRDIPKTLRKLPTARLSRTYSDWPVINLDKVPREAALGGRDFKVYKTRKAIKAAIMAAVRTPKQLARSVTVDAPFDSGVFKALYSGSSVRLVLPLDSETEKLGLRWTRSPDVGQRVEAVKILRSFKSQANVKLLRSLLEDRGYYTTTRSDGKHSTRVYAVRRDACLALRAWGVVTRCSGGQQ
jgi:hypothetical protein